MGHDQPQQPHSTSDTMSAPTFEPARLRLARELLSLSQASVAKGVNVTPAALSQFESGAARPGPETQQRLADFLRVPVDYFRLPLVDTHDGFFRSPRRTLVADRKRARAIAHVAHDLATHSANDHLAAPSVPQVLLSVEADPSDAEKAAEQVRAEWGLPSGPIDNVAELIEQHGIVVIRLPLESADVDAFSLPFADRPVIVLGTDKNDRARSRFDGAHELGHLVMHSDQVWGMAAVEKQAHAFAAAFLMPADDIYDELPTYADWTTFFELKQKWQVSLAALLMRARKLGRMPEPIYSAAMKTMSARGWRRVEPVPLGEPEKPQIISQLAERPELAALHSALPSQIIDTLRSAAAAG